MAIISYLTKIQFDFGAIALLPEELAALGVRRPLIVTDKGIADSGLLDRVREVLPKEITAAVFDGTPENPTEAGVLEAHELYREQDCDGVIGLGGGSSLDLAKGARLKATHDGPLASYALIDGGLARIRADMPPLVAIPTTAGTGSEVGRGAVIVMSDGRKVSLISPHMLPSVAICDPELTLGLPARLTAATGLDAMAHCIETFLSPLVNPPAEAIALDGLGRVCRNLERATDDGGDREARWQMMMAAMEGAMAFQKGLGAVHAMSHPLGALPGLKLHHGTLNAVVMPAVLRFNRDHVGDKYGRIAEVMGLSFDTEVFGAVAELNRKLGMPAGLREMGVEKAWFPELAEHAVKDHCTATNPRPAGVEDYIALFEDAWE